MVSNTFGDMLYTETNFFDFPSPKDLKRKILISTKPPSASFNDQEKSEQKYRPRSDTGSNNSGEFLNVEIKVDYCKAFISSKFKYYFIIK